MSAAQQKWGYGLPDQAAHKAEPVAARDAAGSPRFAQVRGDIVGGFAAAFVIAILTFTSLIAYLPRVVIAAMLVVVAIQLFDRWTLQILAKLCRREFIGARRMLIDLAVIVVVTAVAMAMNIVVAVFTGIAVAMLVFLYRMSKSVVRRAYRCDAIHSRKTREPRLTDLLATHGARILVLELEGPIFFGTAENLDAYIESSAGADVSYVVFDLKRVNEIDTTGARIIVQIHERLKKQKKFLLIAGVEKNTHLANVIDDTVPVRPVRVHRSRSHRPRRLGTEIGGEYARFEVQFRRHAAVAAVLPAAR